MLKDKSRPFSRLAMVISFINSSLRVEQIIMTIIQDTTIDSKIPHLTKISKTTTNTNFTLSTWVITIINRTNTNNLAGVAEDRTIEEVGFNSNKILAETVEE